jgi:FMN phosphatase YigB (HAD superfamily)
MKETLRLVAFDLDDTLTVSKSKIDQHMADLLADLLARLDVCIITGGTFGQIQAQVLQYLHAPAARLVHLLSISPDEWLFIGDRLEEGGNDYPVRALGVRWVEVTQWQDTARYVQDLLRQI